MSSLFLQLVSGFTRRTWYVVLCLFFAILLLSAPNRCARAQGLRSPDAARTSYGGHHEFGAAVGYSPVGGPIWGYTQNVRYSPTVLRYSYLVIGNKDWAFRYSPEVTAISILHEQGPTITNPAAPITHFGAGLSPEGFQIVVHPRARVQPFFSHDGGMLYYADRVLSPQGSRFMFTIDFGAGVNLFTSSRNAMQLGYHYQHLSNANISEHNPGTDADTFYIGFSHFHTRRVR